MSKKNKKILSTEALSKIIEIAPKNSKILDIGAGQKQIHANLFRENGFVVHTVDFFEDSTYRGDFNQLEINEKYDIVWASHCLEHQLNVHNFLKKIKSNVKENGLIVITVPPLKHEIVSGHVNLWNAGLLLYNLILTGTDCSTAIVKKYGYNISVIIKNKTIDLPKLTYNAGDLIRLQKYFPNSLKMAEKNCAFSGDIDDIGWDNENNMKELLNG